MNCNRCGEILSKYSNTCPKCGYVMPKDSPDSFGSIVADKNNNDIEVNKDSDALDSTENIKIKNSRILSLLLACFVIFQFLNLGAFGAIFIIAFLYLFFTKSKNGKLMKINLLVGLGNVFTKSNLSEKLNLESNNLQSINIKKAIKFVSIFSTIFFISVIFIVVIFSIIMQSHL